MNLKSIMKKIEKNVISNADIVQRKNSNSKDMIEK